MTSVRTFGFRPFRVAAATAVLSALALAGVASAADDKAPTDKHPAMDPAMMELMKPGPEHQQLAKAAGTWDASARMWMQPGGQPTESKGTAVFRPIFDGRFIQEEYKSDFMGQPFTGMGVIGYDRMAKHYSSGWIDNMSTAIMYLTGSSSDGGKTITYTGTMICPQDGKPMAMRHVMTMQSDDRMLYEMYDTRDGKEAKAMEIAYTRRK